MSNDNDTSQSWEQITETSSETSGTEYDGEGTQETVGNDTGGSSQEYDGTGDSDGIGTSSGNVQRSLQSSGSGVGETAGDEQGTVSDGTSTYEGVTSESFQAMYEGFDAKLDALNASSLVLVFAMFFCAGAIAVDTLLRSLEWKK